MPGQIEAYRNDFRSQAAKPNFIGQQTTGLSFGQWSQWFNLVPHTRPNVLACYVKFSCSVVGATVTPVAGVDQLGAALSQVQVSPSAGLAPRSQILSTKAIEDVEQACFDTSFTYPRGTLPSVAGSFAAYVYIPIGGNAAAVRFLLPSSTTAFSAGTLVINSITVYTIEGYNGTVIAAYDQNTPSLGSGLQDMHSYLSGSIAPDLVVLEGETDSTVTQVQMADQTGTLMVSVTDADALSNGAIGFTPITGALKNGLAISTQSAVPSLFQANFVSATTHDILEIQFYGSQVTNTAGTPQTTPAVPAGTQVGVTNAANVPVPAGGATTGQAARRRY